MTTPLVRKEPEGLRMEAETATLTRIARSAPIVGARRLLPREKLTDVGAETVIDATTTTAAIGASIATMTAVARRPADLYHDVLHLAVRRHGARHRAAMIEATTPAISGACPCHVHFDCFRHRTPGCDAHLDIARVTMLGCRVAGVMTVGTGTASTIGAVVGLTTAEAATTIGATTEGGATIGGGVRASAPRPRGARSRLRKTTASPSASGTASRRAPPCCSAHVSLERAHAHLCALLFCPATEAACVCGSGWTRTSRRW
eukprot:5688579-Pleurochrysis_carterae.AAC.2